MVDRLLEVTKGFVFRGDLGMKLAFAFLAFNFDQLFSQKFSEKVAKFVFVSVRRPNEGKQTLLKSAKKPPAPSFAGVYRRFAGR